MSLGKPLKHTILYFFTEYLYIVLDEKDCKFLPLALIDIARACKAMSIAVKAAGVTRTNLYQSLSENGYPAFKTVAKVAGSLDYKLALVPISKSVSNKPRRNT